MANTTARRRAALASIGLGTVLALCPQVWAQTSTANTGTTAGPAPGVMLQQESFAPLVKRVLPAVVNISVTETGKASPMADEEEQGQDFRQSPFDDMLRRFFDQQGQGQGRNSPFSEEGPGDGAGVKRIALGSGFII